ncbi:putative membrane protein [Thermoflavifilum thermophilum]|uniref:Putative membrane protein n=2 Tax=Thermoflavifilum thermophilum TaxID=1393122 RepID=A0A1I7NCL0_9BACT|nr:putative membrane protein [Thermoflavifilum thermophilum]
MNMDKQKNGVQHSYTGIIVTISVVIPLVVAALFILPHPDIRVGFRLTILPFFNAICNSVTAILLLASLYFIKHGQRQWHMRCNLAAVVLSVLFLISYVIYHSLAPETHFGGEGVIRYVYFFILITHILLAAVIVPLVLITLVRALQGRFDRHKKIARITWPLWFYVAVTGVLVYVLISPYYPH